MGIPLTRSYVEEQTVEKLILLPSTVFVDDDPDRFEAGREAANNSTAADWFASKDELNQMVEYFLYKGNFRDALLIVLGSNTGVRPRDLVEHRWRDLFDGDEFRSITFVKESKTQRYGKKPKMNYMNQAIEEMAWMYRKSLRDKYDPDAYIFTSRTREGHVPPSYRGTGLRVYAENIQPIHVRSLTRIIRNAAKELGIYKPGHRITAYSLRKVKANAAVGLVEGVELYEETRELLSKAQVAQILLGHKKLETTLNSYLGVGQRIEISAAQAMNFGFEAIQKFKKERGWD